INEAKREGIKVLAYDRMINNADIDFYISFDNEKVGELQAQSLVQRVPQGNYFLMGGSPVDNNAKLFRQGQMKVLQPLIDGGKIKLVGDQWVDGWLPENALKIMENALTANNNKIDAVVASNDATAGGAIQALAAQGLAGKVAISGQDADLAAVKRIVAGTQTMTVYKPISKLADEAAGIAVQLGKGEQPKTNATLNNGSKEVPSWLLTPIPVDKSNIDSTIIADGFHKKSDIN
ncbi:MAG: D-xylose ABC transporter substrate-binding protein, partial [Serratia liquefaciens]|nr:D-xylose ABC transporter substrate-binding protein [Serratia liquefaciens]